VLLSQFSPNDQAQDWKKTTEGTTDSVAVSHWIITGPSQRQNGCWRSWHMFTLDSIALVQNKDHSRTGGSTTDDFTGMGYWIGGLRFK
jgi:hypothetical protein